MPLYSRADYDEEIVELDALSAQISRACAQGKLSGLDVLKYDKVLEAARKEAWNKLQRTRLVLSDPGRKRKKAQGDPENTYKVNTAEVSVEVGRKAVATGLTVRWVGEGSSARAEIRL